MTFLVIGPIICINIQEKQWSMTYDLLIKPINGTDIEENDDYFNNISVSQNQFCRESLFLISC